jgi:hypothetical protein
VKSDGLVIGRDLPGVRQIGLGKLAESVGANQETGSEIQNGGGAFLVRQERIERLGVGSNVESELALSEESGDKQEEK